MEPSEVPYRFGGPAQAHFTIEPSPMTEELRSYWVLNCTQAVLFTQSWYRRRFESHLGLGTFTDVNLYLFSPFFFQSLFLLKPQPYPHPHWTYLAAKKNSSLFLEYQWRTYHCPLIFIVCSKFIFDYYCRCPPDGGRTQKPWVPSPGPYHWATATVERSFKLRNFI